MSHRIVGLIKSLITRGVSLLVLCIDYCIICYQIDIRYATIVQPDFTLRVHLVHVFIATVRYSNCLTRKPCCRNFARKSRGAACFCLQPM